MKCAGKWSRDHQCPPQVQLNVVQEILEIFSQEEPLLIDIGDSDASSSQLLVLYAAATTDSLAPRTLNFIGMLGSRPVLLDSGSTHTFVSSRWLLRVHN